MSNDDLTGLRDATQTLVDLVGRLYVYYNGEGTLSDVDLDNVLRESGPAIEAWQESFRQSVITARTVHPGGVSIAPAGLGDPPAELSEPLNPA